MKTKNIPTATYYLQIKRLFANNQTVDKNKMRMLPDKKNKSYFYIFGYECKGSGDTKWHKRFMYILGP